MGTSNLMSIGMRAMMANYAALQTTGHNIANAGVAGYSRQTAELATATGQFTGAGFFGKGVDVQTVSRAHDAYLTREAASSRSLASMDQARLTALQQLESVFKTGEQGVGHAAGQFLNAMVDLASLPADNATRQVVLARATEAAGRFADAGQQLDTVQNGVTESLKAAVDSLNGLAKDMAKVNQQIAAAKGLGQSPNDLLDERDRLIGKISDLVQISTIPSDDGTVGVFIAGGQRLVLGSQASPMALVPDPENSSRAAIAINDSGFNRVLADGTLGGGSIAGYLQFQNRDLVDARNQLGQLAIAFSAAVNDQQSFGLDLRNPPGTGGPIFSTGSPQALPNASNVRGPGGAFVSQVTLGVADASQLVASDYELRADSAGTPGAWQLTRRSDGVVRTVVDGDTVDGFTISLGAPPPVVTDRFVLQPVGSAASNMRRVLDDIRGIAAASPVTASTSPANTGTATVGTLAVVNSAINPDQSANITFTSATGDYAWELRDRTTNALLSSGTSTWTPGSPIALNGFELSINGVPASGDGFSVVKTAFPAANNTNALALVALRDSAFVGRSMQSDGRLGGGQTVTDAFASTIANVGVRVQGAGTAATISSAVASQAELVRSAASGVNLDEEAARLLAFQQSYQAAAKVLQVAQQIFDTLLQTANA
jgi:flagellar hook-associated protein 1 FlgK